MTARNADLDDMLNEADEKLGVRKQPNITSVLSIDPSCFLSFVDPRTFERRRRRTCIRTTRSARGAREPLSDRQ